jgi:hypothetical protein
MAMAKQLFEDEAAGRLPGGAVSSDIWGETSAELLLWSGAAGGQPDIVRMALERVTWPRHDPRWWWMLWHPLYAGEAQWETRGLACFRQILTRCDPNVSLFFKRTILHDVIAAGDEATAEARLAFALAVLDAGARLDIRDELLESTPLGWACRWGRLGIVRVLLDRGADLLESDAQPWATPRAWAEKMNHGDVLALLQERSSR